MIHQTYFDKIKKGARDLKFSMAVVEIVSTFSKNNNNFQCIFGSPKLKLDQKNAEKCLQNFHFS